jgi:hypothetical protein
MRFYLDGEMPPYLLAKDIILQVGRRVRDACQAGPAFQCRRCMLHARELLASGLRAASLYPSGCKPKTVCLSRQAALSKTVLVRLSAAWPILC